VAVRVGHGTARLKHIWSLLGYNIIKTSAGERHTGTRRLRKQRKVRTTLAFANATRYPRWLRWLAVGLYHVCHAPRSLKSQHEAQVSPRSPAMAAKLADHIWATGEWLLCPVLGG
jgi:hypothetical protein